MNDAWNYVLILAAYSPGAWIALRSSTCARLPIVTCAFLGLLIFNALGYGLVVARKIPHEPIAESVFDQRMLATDDYFWMLILQALIFYAVVGPYVYFCRRRPKPVADPLDATPLADKRFERLAVTTIVLMLAAFAAFGGRFVLFDLIAGYVNHENILDYRRLTYGVPYFWIFRLGFLALSMMLAGATLMRARSQGRLERGDILRLALSVAPQLLLGEKSGILYIVVGMLIAYSLHSGLQGRTISSLFNTRCLMMLAVAAIPTLIAYRVYYRNEPHSLLTLGEFALFRVVGVYSESLAASVHLREVVGDLSGQTLPTLHGLFPHDRFNIETNMHSFLWTGELTKNSDAIAGSISLPAVGEGYLNIAFPGFVAFAAASCLVTVGVQELFLRLRLGITGRALHVWYAWLAAMTATTSLFATLASLVHTMFFLAVVVAWHLLARKHEPQVERSTAPLRRVA